MKRHLKIWLALLAALWFTRAAVSALLFETADRSAAGIVQVIAISVLQALVVGWLTRDRKPPVE